VHHYSDTTPDRPPLTNVTPTYCNAIAILQSASPQKDMPRDMQYHLWTAPGRQTLPLAFSAGIL